MRSGVVVTQPGSHHLWRTAVALEEAGLLAAYVTGVLYEPDRLPYTLRKALPPAMRERLEAELSKRRHTELDVATVVTASGLEWAHLALARLGAPWRLLRAILDARNVHISQVAGRTAARQATAIWGCMDGSLESFTETGKEKVLHILDAFTGHPRALNDTLQYERERFPNLVSASRDWVRPAHLDRLEREIALADLVVTGSEFARDTYLAHGVPAHRLRVIPYGVNTNQFTPTEQLTTRGKLRALFVGAVGVRKGCHHLIEAMRLAPNVELTLVGTLENRQLLEGAGPNVSWLSPVAHADLPAIFREADVYVFPSLFEGSSLSVYEALSSGLPVVTTRESGSVVQNGVEGFIVPPRDPRAIAEKLDLLSHDTELCVHMGRSARARALEYTWNTYSKRVVELIAEIIEMRRKEK